MTKNLVIVESPAKAKTIKKYLGKDFEVMASYGHVRDLVPKEGAVDPTRNFAMRWELIDKNRKHVDAISRAMKKADALYLSTDPDREGEAISWHLYQLLKDAGSLDGKSVHRSVFYEITKKAVQEAVDNPREIADELVKAYLARRALDYLVGFNLSPLLWKKAGLSGASAGRVQSPALRMICEREEEILAFKPREYWSIDAQVEKNSQQFTAKLTELAAARWNSSRWWMLPGRIGTQDAAASGRRHAGRHERRKEAAQAQSVAAVHDLDPATGSRTQAGLRGAAHDAPRSAPVRGRRLRRRPGRPHHLHAHRLRQSRPRCDSRDPQRDRARVRQHFAADAPRIYRTKSKNAQEAHEAVRPTDAARAPEQLAGKLEQTSTSFTR
jgi:DNA topoisomerase-1